MRTQLGAAVAIFVLASCFNVTMAFNEPDGFRGVPWGASEDALRDKLGAASVNAIMCVAYPPAQQSLGDRYCTDTFSLGGKRVHAQYTFRDSHFVGVTLGFPSPEFDYLASIFSERYGAPTSSDHQIHRWHGERTTITIQRSGDPQTWSPIGHAFREGQASLRLRTDAEEARRRKKEIEENERLRRQQRIRDAAKDL